MGDDPYDHEQFERLWDIVNPRSLNNSVKPFLPSIYPPSTFVIITPLSWLTWPLARNAMAIGNSLLAILSLYLLATSAMSRAKIGFWAYLICGLSFAPLHTGIANGNLITLAWAGALSGALLHNTHPLTGNLLLSVAVALKPHIGLPYVISFSCNGKVKNGMIILGLAGIFLFAGVTRMRLAGVAWEHSLTNNVLKSTEIGASNDPGSANPVRHDLINLQRAFYPLVGSARSADWLALLICAGLFGIYLWLQLKPQRAKRPDEMLSLSAVLVISLLPVYHRFYDASLLLLPLAWCFKNWNVATSVAPKIVLGLILPFLIPGAALLKRMMEYQMISRRLAGAWWWETIVMSHQVWLLCMIALGLLYACWKDAGGNQQASTNTVANPF
jgi:hypothetical protein